MRREVGVFYRGKLLRMRRNHPKMMKKSPFIKRIIWINKVE